MKFAWLLVLSMPGWSATLTITPSTIYDCHNSEGTAVLTWSGASGPVQIHALKPDGPAVNGFAGTSGTATTGNWVSNGLQFFLVNRAGIIEASATAQVFCGATANTLNAGLQGGSYFPLQVGNQWVYRASARGTFDYYTIRTITRTEVINGKTWFVMMDGSNLIGKYRGDNNGVIYVATDTGEQVYLDPTSSAFQNTGYSGPLGTFSDALTENVFSGLNFDSSTFVRGIGLAFFNENLDTGSSGGLVYSLQLEEARLNGIRLSVPAPSIHLSIEDTILDLTSKKAPNCPIPCYFVACYIAPGTPDPPGTYRPCAQTRIETTAGPGDSVQLQLIDPSGAVTFTTTAATDAKGNSFQYIRLPLYTSPEEFSLNFTLLPPGDYKLTGRLLKAGMETASSTIDVQVR
ncbi:MAG TPA: hypothetical protein VKT81_16565 [Bryobacteraceae bacterium]|nr:hypothetical protein [Bryobacteraceae bacterium]